MDTIKKYGLIGLSIILAIVLAYLYFVESELDNTKLSLNIANKKIDSLNDSIEKTKQEQKTINDLDKEYQEKLRDAQIENDKLRDDVINNVKRVYIKADCPAVPTTPATTSGTNARPTELTREARQDYLYLRLEIQQTINQVKGLQDYINNVCLK